MARYDKHLTLYAKEYIGIDTREEGGVPLQRRMEPKAQHQATNRDKHQLANSLGAICANEALEI